MRLAVVAGLLTLLGVRPASACSCGYDAFAVPEHDATDVPINIRELVVSRYSVTFLQLRRADTNEDVPISDPVAVPGLSGPARIAVLEELAPSTVYTLLEDGTREILRFTTGDAADEVAPAVVGIGEYEITVSDLDHQPGTCGPARWSTTNALALPPDARTLGVRFTLGDRRQEFLLAAHHRALHTFNTSACAVHVSLEEGVPYTVEVWARDIAGNDGPIATTSVTLEAAGGGGCRSSSDDDEAALWPLLLALLLRYSIKFCKYV